MKTLPAGLQDHLDGGATTLCWCWKLQTATGALGFTDHDHDIEFDGVVFEAASGFNGTEIETSLGLSVDSLDVEGALSSAKLNEDDLFAGVYDNAIVEIWQVNWSNLAQRILLRKGNLGEVSRSDVSFTAEIRGVAHNLNQPAGRLFQFGCDAELGSPRCGVNLATPQYKATGGVAKILDSHRFKASGLSGFADGWFANGVLQFSSGANNGFARQVKAHQSSDADVIIELWQQLPRPLAQSDGFEITAGCDKSFETCRAKFNNRVNFQGFPHMPGNDFVAFYPNRDDAKNDGGAFS